MDINEARELINSVDTQMAVLFAQRMKAVREIAFYKKERGIPVEDKERETRVLESHLDEVGDDGILPYYIRFMRSAIELSKHYQRLLVSGIRVSYCGAEGAFAQIAASRIFPGGSQVPFPSFSDAYMAVVSGNCDAAVLPIENSQAGEVGPVLDLMYSGSLYVNGVYDLSVSHNLLSLPGASIDDIKKVVSHPQALFQCAKYIHDHGFETREAENTAIAAKNVSEGSDPHVGAIASADAARLYGLQILECDINESRSNTTRFAVFSSVENKAREKKSGMGFILLFTVRDEVGSLSKAVNTVSAYGFNMRVLRSRPVKDLPWHYYFYAEVEGDDLSDNGKRMMKAMEGVCKSVKIAGRYTAGHNSEQGGESI